MSVCPVCDEEVLRHDRFVAHVERHGQVLECGDCFGEMILRPTDPGKVGYRCRDYPVCLGAHAAFGDGRPVGTPADHETRRWRSRAHDAFDPLWRSGRMSREAAYNYLASLMNLDPDDAHIGRFSKAQCRRVIDLLRAGDGTAGRPADGRRAPADNPSRRGDHSSLGATIAERLEGGIE